MQKITKNTTHRRQKTAIDALYYIHIS